VKSYSNNPDSFSGVDGAKSKYQKAKARKLKQQSGVKQYKSQNKSKGGKK
jgi:hypothetical protein